MKDYNESALFEHLVFRFRYITKNQLSNECIINKVSCLAKKSVLLFIEIINYMVYLASIGVDINDKRWHLHQTFNG